MLEHTTLDDFMRGLYTKERSEGYSHLEEKEKNVMGALLTGQGLDFDRQRDQVVFGDEEQQQEDANADLLRQKALINLRDRRMRLK